MWEKNVCDINRLISGERRRRRQVGCIRINIVIRVQIRTHRKPDLANIARAGRPLTPSARSAEHRKQNPDEQGDDGDDDEKLDERKSAESMRRVMRGTMLMTATADPGNDLMIDHR